MDSLEPEVDPDGVKDCESDGSVSEEKKRQALKLSNKQMLTIQHMIFLMWDPPWNGGGNQLLAMLATL